MQSVTFNFAFFSPYSKWGTAEFLWELSEWQRTGAECHHRGRYSTALWVDLHYCTLSLFLTSNSAFTVRDGNGSLSLFVCCSLGSMDYRDLVNVVLCTLTVLSTIILKIWVKLRWCWWSLVSSGHLENCQETCLSFSSSLIHQVTASIALTWYHSLCFLL